MNVRAKKIEPHSSLSTLKLPTNSKTMHIDLCVKMRGLKIIFVQLTPRFEVYIC